MRVFPFLRRFNVVAIALICVAVMGLLIIWAVTVFNDWRQDRLVESESGLSNQNASEFSGQLIDANGRKLTLYSKGGMNDEIQRDLQFVDARDGAVVRISANPDARFRNGAVVGIPRTGKMNRGYGYLVLSENEGQARKPLFDAIFVRFSDMKVITIASGIEALDGPQELDGASFSAVIWNAQGRSRFILFDSPQGKVVMTRELDLEGGAQQPGPDSAPINRFD